MKQGLNFDHDAYDTLIRHVKYDDGENACYDADINKMPPTLS